MLPADTVLRRLRARRVGRTRATFAFAALALAPLAASTASPAPAKLFAGFDPAKVPAPPASGPRPLARVFDEYIMPDSVGLITPQLVDEDFMRLTNVVWDHLIRRLRLEEGLVATPADMDSLVRDYEVKVPGGWEQVQYSSPRKLASWARETVLAWKTDSLLHHRYGGRAVFEPSGSVMPMDARAAFLREMDARHVFQIGNPDVRTRFFERFTRGAFEFDLPPDQVDFSRPWWQAMPVARDGPAVDAPSPTVANRDGAPAFDVGFVRLANGASFVFDPASFQTATHGTTGRWELLSNLEIRSVCLAGDFNDWSATAWVMRPAGPAGAIFVMERSAAELGGHGRHEFKFVVNGQWWVEPPADARNRSATRLGNEGGNLVIELP